MAKFTTISVHAPRRARPPPVILYMALTDFASAPPKHPLLALEDISSTVPRRDCRHHPYARHSRSTSNIPASPTPDSGVNSDPNVPGSLPDPQVTTVAPIPAHRFKIQRPRGVHSMGRWQLLRSFAMGSQAKALSDFVTAAVVKDKMLDLNKSFEKQSEEKILALQNKVLSVFPSLNGYEDLWPLRYLIILECKNGKSRGMMKETKRIAAAVQRRACTN